MSKLNPTKRLSLRFRRLVTGLALGLVSGLASVAANVAYAADEALMIDAEGIVHEISVGESKVLISGVNYDVVPHAKVTVRGNSSSIAALRPGMKVRFVYEIVEGYNVELAARIEGSVISELEQLPDSQVVLEF